MLLSFRDALQMLAEASEVEFNAYLSDPATNEDAICLDCGWYEFSSRHKPYEQCEVCDEYSVFNKRQLRGEYDRR